MSHISCIVDDGVRWWWWWGQMMMMIGSDDRVTDMRTRADPEPEDLTTKLSWHITHTHTQVWFYIERTDLSSCSHAGCPSVTLPPLPSLSQRSCAHTAKLTGHAHHSQRQRRQVIWSKRQWFCEDILSFSVSVSTFQSIAGYKVN